MRRESRRLLRTEDQKLPRESGRCRAAATATAGCLLSWEPDEDAKVDEADVMGDTNAPIAATQNRVHTIQCVDLLENLFELDYCRLILKYFSLSSLQIDLIFSLNNTTETDPRTHSTRVFDPVACEFAGWFWCLEICICCCCPQQHKTGTPISHQPFLLSLTLFPPPRM